MTMRVPVRLLAGLAMLFAAAGAQSAAAQSGGSYPVSTADFSGPSGSPVQRAVASHSLVDAHGDRAVIPAQYACPPGAGYGGDGYMGAYGGMGYSTDQVGPHYFDASIEWVAYKRQELFSSTQIFSATRFVGEIGGAQRTVLLSSDQLQPETQSGFRVTGRYDIGALSVLEVSYMGIFDAVYGATAADTTVTPGNLPGSLFSPFTNFGEGFADQGFNDDAVNGFIASDLGLFEETDRATQHTIGYESDLQTAELSYRRYWVGFSPRISGTLLAGFRYTKLKEKFRFDSIGNDFNDGDMALPANAPVTDPNDPVGIGTAQYRITSDNDLAGFQAGGDIWLGVVQGLRFGSEAKVGLYNNHYTMETTFTTSDGTPPFTPEVWREDQAAFIGEGKVMFVADIWPSWSVKGGYEVLYMTSLALVGENFNAGSPYVNADAVPARVATREDQGNAFYHGWHLGLEYIW